MNNGLTYTMAVDISADLAAGNVNIDTKKAEATASGYNFLQRAILINKGNNDEETVTGIPFGQTSSVAMKLKCGEIHNIAFRQINKTGTTSTNIVILGEVF